MASLAVLVTLITASAVTIGCGDDDPSDTASPISDRAAILRSAEAYFLYDEDPDPDVYCRSFVSVREPETLPSGRDYLATAEKVQPDLVEDADATEAECHEYLDLVLDHDGHVGYRDAEIGEVRIQGEGIRGHVMATWGERGERNAFVGRIGPGDWRILNAGWD